MIKRLINNKFLNEKPTQSVVAAAFIITVAGIISNVLGLFRDRMLASTFGAGDTLDVYYAAFRIPDLIYNLLILGALSAAFIPVFTGLMSKDKEDDAWKLANGMANLAIFFIIIFSALFALFAPILMRIITPGFPPAKIDNVVIFTRIMFLSPLFLGISGIMGGILTSMKRFLVYSIAPLLYNLGIIIGIVFFVKWMGPIGLAWGVVFGAFLHMTLQYLTVRNLGYTHHWELINSWNNSEVRKVLKLMLPRMVGISVNQFNLIITTTICSTLAAGSLAIFQFATNLQSVPLCVFGISFSIAVFPTLSAFAAKGEKEKFVEAFSETFRQILFFVIPSSVFMWVLRAQIVRVILGSGKFDWNDTILTFQTLGILVLCLFAQSLVQLLARSFYALQDTKTPFYIAIVTEAVYISSAILLTRQYQILGVAIAVSFSSVIQMLLLLHFLRGHFDGMDGRNILKSVSKILAASLAAGIVIQVSKVFVASMVNLNTFVGIFQQMLVSSLLGLGVFVLVCQLLKLEEFILFKKALTKKLLRGKQAVITESTEEVSGI